MNFCWFLSIILCAFYAHGNEGQLKVLEPDQSLDYWVEEGWKKLHRVEPDKILKLTLAIKQQNKDKLERLLLDVSDPDSINYGKYLSVKEITKLVSPHQKSIDILRIWLANNGIASRHCDLTLNRDFLVCKVPCKYAEMLLPGTVFSYFKHDKLKKHYIRSNSRYYVPEYVAEHLDFVGDVHRFPSVNFRKTKQEDLTEIIKQNPGVHVGVYPKILRERYNLTDSDIGSHPNNSQVVAQFLEQYFSNSDLSEFFSLFVGSDFAHVNSINKIIGPNSGRSGIEASLDTQYITGLGANITTWFWSTGGRHANQEPFLEWMVDVGNTTFVPQVHSVSYGDDERSLSVSYMKRINVEFMKLGVRGSSILFSSGDDGAGCKHHKFNPSFPVSSPYVTGVGGTGFNNPFTVSTEFAYEISGGGFSNVFDQPSYQTTQVSAYLNSTACPPLQYFNKTGRAYPDVAAICRHFWIVNNRIPAPGVMGTSASTPTVAGIISMLNDHRLKNKKPPMGFLNPFIYKNPQALYDVTTGYNEGCLAHDKGFYATKGYDPVTGNGTPNYPELVKAAMAMFS